MGPASINNSGLKIWHTSCHEEFNKIHSSKYLELKLPGSINLVFKNWHNIRLQNYILALDQSISEYEMLNMLLEHQNINSEKKNIKTNIKTKTKILLMRHVNPISFNQK